MPVNFTKVRMIQDDDYEDCRNHTCAKCGNECNLSMIEMNDELNKKYYDTISSDNAKEQCTDDLNTEADNNIAEADNELNAGVQGSAQVHEASSNITDSQSVSNNDEAAISNPPDMNAGSNQVSNLNNAVTTQNIPQVSSESTASAANLTPPTIAPVIAQNDVVYNCTPDVSTKLPGKPVSPAKPIQPYPCSLCSKSYSTRSGLNRHVRDKHTNAAVVEQSTPQQQTPVVSQPTSPSIVVGQKKPELIEVDGLPLAAKESPEDVPPLPHEPLFTLGHSGSKKVKKTKKKPTSKTVPESHIITRNMKKRKMVIDSEDEDVEHPKKIMRMRGGNFYCSWD